MRAGAWGKGRRTRFPRSLLLLDLLAAKVLDRNLIQLDALDALGYLLFDLFGRRIVLEGKLSDFVFDKRRVIVYEAATAKNHGALNIGRPVVVFVPIVAIDGKADFVAAFECIDLMSGFSAVEVNLVMFGVKVVVDGNGVRIAIVSVDGENAAFAIDEQFTRLLIGDGAFLTAKRPKHRGFPFYLRVAATAAASSPQQDTSPSCAADGNVLFDAECPHVACHRR